MLKVTDIEKRMILELHSNYKQKLTEQTAQKPQEIESYVKPESIAYNITQNKICFCKTAICNNPYRDSKSGDILIQAKMPNASESIDSQGNKRYEANDELIFNINKFIYTVSRTGKSYTWGCQTLTQTITNMRDSLLKYYTEMGYKPGKVFNFNPDIYDPNKFETKNLGAIYPHLFPRWESIDTNNYILYKPKSSDVQSDIARNDYEKKIIEDFKIRYKNYNLKTQQEIMDEREVTDFSIVASEYEPFPIGQPGDGKFNRVFNLYRKKSGQSSAKEIQRTAKESEKVMNINKNTCKGLIKRLYGLFKLKDAAFSQISEPDFNKLKQQVTYCSRAYDNYGLLGSDKIDSMLSELKTTPLARFKIK